MPSPHQVVVFSMECVGFSKALSAISSHSPPTLEGKILALEIGRYSLACFVLFLQACIEWDSLFWHLRKIDNFFYSSHIFDLKQ